VLLRDHRRQVGQQPVQLAVRLGRVRALQAFVVLVQVEPALVERAAQSVGHPLTVTVRGPHLVSAHAVQHASDQQDPRACHRVQEGLANRPQMDVAALG
jgi:hypothetical protein